MLYEIAKNPSKSFSGLMDNVYKNFINPTSMPNHNITGTKSNNGSFKTDDNIIDPSDQVQPFEQPAMHHQRESSKSLAPSSFKFQKSSKSSLATQLKEIDITHIRFSLVSNYL